MLKFDLELYTWVADGSQRRAILKALTGSMTPTMVRKESLQYNPKISLTHASKILKSFEERGLTVCLNKGVKRSKIYELTELGSDMRNVLLLKVKIGTFNACNE